MIGPASRSGRASGPTRRPPRLARKAGAPAYPARRPNWTTRSGLGHTERRYRCWAKAGVRGAESLLAESVQPTRLKFVRRSELTPPAWPEGPRRCRSRRRPISRSEIRWGSLLSGATCVVSDEAAGPTDVWAGPDERGSVRGEGRPGPSVVRQGRWQAACRCKSSVLRPQVRADLCAFGASCQAEGLCSKRHGGSGIVDLRSWALAGDSEEPVRSEGFVNRIARVRAQLTRPEPR